MTATELVMPCATRNSLPASVRSQMAALLNRRLADESDLQCQCRQAHWNVKGAPFIALYQLFDEVNAAVAGCVDLIAERIVQLGGVAEDTVCVAAERSELDEYPLTMWDGREHARSLSTALGAFGSRICFAIRELDELEDAGSADLCTEVSRGIDKYLWFVEAHLQSHRDHAALTERLTAIVHGPALEGGEILQSLWSRNHLFRYEGLRPLGFRRRRDERQRGNGSSSAESPARRSPNLLIRTGCAARRT
jgi:starvation-inducible DNA-binding protein